MPRYLAVLFSILLVLSSTIPSYVGVELQFGPFFSVPRIILIIVIFLVFIGFAFHISIILRDFDSKYCLFVVPTWEIGKIIFIYLVVMVTSALLSTNPSNSLQSLVSERFLLGVILLLFGFNIAQTAHGREIIERALIFSAVITIVIGVVDTVLGRSLYSLIDLPGREEIKEGYFSVKERFGFIRLQSSMNNPVTYGAFLVIVFPLVILHIKNTTNVINKVFLTTLCIAIMVFAVMTLVRSVVIVIFVQMILLRRVLSTNFKVFMYGLTLLSVFAVSLTNDDLIYEAYNSFVLQKERTIKHSTLYRIALFHSGMSSFAESPVFGIGQNRFGSEVQGEYLGKIINFTHHENLFLTILVETGIVGFIVFVWLILSTISALKRLRTREVKNSNEVYLSHAYIAMLVGWVVVSLFLDSLSFIQISIPFWLLLGIALGLNARVKCIQL